MRAVLARPPGNGRVARADKMPAGRGAYGRRAPRPHASPPQPSAARRGPPMPRRRSMKRRTRLLAATASAVIAFAGGLLAVTAPSASAAALTEVTNFGANPSGLRMYEYVPNNV